MGNQVKKLCCLEDESDHKNEQGQKVVKWKKPREKKQDKSKMNEDDKSIPDSIKTSDEQIPVKDHGCISDLSDEKMKYILGQQVSIRKMKFDDFEIEGKLGKGSFGTVYLGQLKNNIKKGKIQKYAIKRVPKELLLRKNILQNAFHQRNILGMCDCKFIVNLVMAFQDPWFIYLVMQFASGGQTFSLIDQKNSPKQKIQCFTNLGEVAVRFIAACVILGLQFLHSKNYVYRDLKPQNLLLFQNGYVKLTDFGLAKKLIQGQVIRTCKGTRLYLAPEMVLQIGYSKIADLWALGVLLYQFSNYQPPFMPQDITRTKFKAACLEGEKQRSWKNPDTSPQLKDLINGLLRFDQKRRLGAKNWQQVKQHPFFQNFDWQLLKQQKMKSPLAKLVQKYPISLKSYTPEPLGINYVSAKQIDGWSVPQKTINNGN